MPFDALFQLPDHREAVFGQPVIFLARNFGGQHRHQIAIAVPSGQRLVEDAAAVLVLGADGEMRVEQGHRLPVQNLQKPAAAGLGRLVGDFGRLHRHAGLASIMPAIGAVRPTAIIRCTKARRDNRPVLTSAIRSRSSRSFIGLAPRWC